MNKNKYRGIIPAFYACYDNNGNVSCDRTAQFARHLINKGINGLYVGGSSGECIYLNPEERMLILESVKSEVKNECTVIAHVACNNTEDSCRLAAHAEKLGVDAIASIPPIYFHLPEHAVAKYWNDISAAAPNTDFIIYNIPQLAGASLTPSLFREMRKNPRVIGVKNSSLPVYDIEIFLREGGSNCIVFNGPDEQFVSGRACGAIGGIGGTYAVMPELFMEMDYLVRNGELEKAMNIQHRVNLIIEKMSSCKGHLYAVIKEVLRINEGLDLGTVRSPLMPLQKEDMETVKEVAEIIRKETARYSS